MDREKLERGTRLVALIDELKARISNAEKDFSAHVKACEEDNGAGAWRVPFTFEAALLSKAAKHKLYDVVLSDLNERLAENERLLAQL